MTRTSNKWRKLKDGTHVLYAGRSKVLEIFKRPHGGWSCTVWDHGKVVTFNGYHTLSLPKKYHAVRWGYKEAQARKLF